MALLLQKNFGGNARIMYAAPRLPPGAALDEISLSGTDKKSEKDENPREKDPLALPLSRRKAIL